MKVASVSEAKNRLSALLDLVRAGETVVIADRGTPVARLEGVPALEDAKGAGARLARLERAGLVRRGTGQVPDVVRQPPPRITGQHPGTAALDAVLQERRTGR